MKLAEAYILWTPHTADVRIVSEPETRGISAAHRTMRLAEGESGSVGGGFFERAEDERDCFMLINALELIGRDGIPAEAVHTALLAVDEYRDAMAERAAR